VDLRPENVHTIVIWSKNFDNFIRNERGLGDLLRKYDQIYLHFTVTGLGAGFIEKGVPAPYEALSQLPDLVSLAMNPKRISLRFDPILFWKESGKVKTNLAFFEKLASHAASQEIEDIRFSFAQWYRKTKRRASVHGFCFIDPAESEKRDYARQLAGLARSLKLNLYSCSQQFLTEGTGIKPSTCIDGRLLQALHPRREPLSLDKDKSQRAECLCTVSRDIGSYAQSCPNSCLYCYANPRI
jgi:hypothetical protein